MLKVNVFGITTIYIFHAITFFILFPTRFSRKKTSTVWGSSILIMAVVCFTIMQMKPDFWGLVSCFTFSAVITFGTVIYLSDKRLAETLFLILAYAQVFMMAVFLSGLLSYFLFDGSPEAAAILRSFLQLGIVILCMVLRGRLNSISWNNVRGWWSLDFLSFLLLAYQGILILHAYADFALYSNSIFVFLLIAVQIAVYWVFFYTIDYMHRVAEAHQAELKSELLQQQIEGMQDAISEAARVRHDARHHNLQIGEYVRKGELEELLYYLEEYEQMAEEHHPKPVCENGTANTILSIYARKAKHSGINVHFDVTLEKEIAIKEVDLVAILANLFENAIHGCIASKKEEQNIEVQIGRKFNKLVIKLCNTCVDNVRIVDGLPRTRSGEGIGISSVLKSVKDYHGEIDFKIEKGIFSCRILLPYVIKN